MSLYGSYSAWCFRIEILFSAFRIEQHSVVFGVSHLHGGRIARVEILQKLQFHAAASIHGAHKHVRLREHRVDRNWSQTHWMRVCFSSMMTFHKWTLHMRECARTHTPAACGPEELGHNLLKFPTPNVLPVNGYQLRQTRTRAQQRMQPLRTSDAESSSERHTDKRCNAQSARQQHTQHT